MYITNNAVYLHVPKTGGTWMDCVLSSIITEGHDCNLDWMPKQYTHCFAAVRNPWAWYVSLYKFCIYGSEMEMPIWPQSIMMTFGAKSVSFETFLKTLLSPSLQFKHDLIKNNRIVMMQNYFVDPNDWALKNRLKNTYKPIAREWLNNHNDYYTHVCNLYLQYATVIGKTETLKDDLSSFITNVGDMTPQVKYQLNHMLPINTTTKDDYREYYSKSLCDLVYDHAKEVINKFGYTFEYETYT